MTRKPFVPVQSKLQVQHRAQIPCEPFCYDVADEREAFIVADALAKQHLFLFEQKIIPDYANTISVVMWDDKDKEWQDYWNEDESMDFDELVGNFLSSRANSTT